MRISRIDAMIMAQENIKEVSGSELERIQLQKLNVLLAREKERGGFYRGLPGRLESLAQLSSLPFTTAEELSAHSASMLMISQAGVERVISDSTSGTTGIAKRVFYTPGDCENTVQLYAAGIGEMAAPGSSVLICMPLSGPRGLTDLISEAVSRLGAKPVAAGSCRSYDEMRSLMEKEKPESIIALPAALLSLLRVCGRGSLKYALVSADACPESVARACEDILGSRLFPHYGSREMGMAGAISCSAHEGMHLRENSVIAEIVSEDGESLPDGEKGELVITTIGMEAMPLIRYRTGDLAKKLPGRCPCGSEAARLEVYGRLGGEAGMPALDDLIFREPGIADYRALLSGTELRLEALALPGADIAELTEVLRAAASSLFPDCRVSADLSFVSGGSRLFYASKRSLLET